MSDLRRAWRTPWGRLAIVAIIGGAAIIGVWALTGYLAPPGYVLLPAATFQAKRRIQ